MSNFKHKPIDLGYELSAQLTKAGRLYRTPKGDYYPSVTTFLGHFGKEGINDWKKAVGEEEAKRVGHHAVTRGNAVHNTAERYLNNEDDYLVECIMPHVRQMWRSMKTVLDSSVNNIRIQECPLYSDVLLLAGRVDLIADYNGALSVIDFKTSSRVKSLEDISSYFLQTCAYSLMFEEHTGIKIDQLVIIMVVENSDKSKVFVQRRSDWEAELRAKRDEFFTHILNDIKNR